MAVENNHVEDEIVAAINFASIKSDANANWPKNTEEVIDTMKVIFVFVAVKILNVEGYVWYFKAELKSTVKSTEEVDKFIKECCQSNGDTLKVATSRFESLFYTNSNFSFLRLRETHSCVCVIGFLLLFLLVFLPILSKIWGNSEQKIILQTIKQLI